MSGYETLLESPIIAEIDNESEGPDGTRSTRLIFLFLYNRVNSFLRLKKDYTIYLSSTVLS